MISMRITGVRAQQTELKESLGKSPGYVTREASQEQLGKSNLLKVGDGKHRVYGLNIEPSFWNSSGSYISQFLYLMDEK